MMSLINLLQSVLAF